MGQLLLTFRVKLHAVRLDAHDRADSCGQLHVRNLRQHRVGEVLHHQRHAVCLGPAGAEDRAGLRLAGLERDAVPAEFAAEPDQLPIVRALVEEQWLAGGDAVHVDAVRLELVRERRLDVEDHPVKLRLLGGEPIEDFVHVRGVGDGAVEIGGQPEDTVPDADRADLGQALVVPAGVVAAQLDL